MAIRDPHCYSNELGQEDIDRLVKRLEGRARDRVFASLFERYAGRLIVSPTASILEVGCGTGAMTRLLAARSDCGGRVTGVDQCPAFITTARELAAAEGLAAKTDFQCGDAQRLDLADNSFDAAFAHTLISHAADPEAVLREMARVVRPGGLIVVFDGDYASLTYACPDIEFGRRMDAALAAATFNNPFIMRRLPQLLRDGDLGLCLSDAGGEAVVEIGAASYFRSFAETYAPAVIKAGLVAQDEVEAWLAGQQQAMQEGAFFASCNYYTYFLQHRRHAV